MFISIQKYVNHVTLTESYVTLLISDEPNFAEY
jgi:hypothetical protein